MIHRLLDRLLPKKEILNCEGDIYLHRWYIIRTEKFGLFIHKFVRSDEDRALHDHPWNFIVIPIWRGYTEHYENLRVSSEIYEGTKRVWPIFGARYRRATYRHRVELFDAHWTQQPPWNDSHQFLPSWSILIRFKRLREWGFQLPTGWINAKQWWSEKCE